jgi:hydrogenase-4 membrane subunit HyfE
MGPKALFVRVIMILLAVAVVVLCYYVVIYVLGMLGIHIPSNILTVIFVIIGLLLVLWAITGRLDNWFAS